MRYCTRKNVHVDRIASAWLIKRFVDHEASFEFVDGQVPAHGAIAFDMHGVELGHHGDDCTFETLVKRFAISDPVISRLAKIIHGADIVTDADLTLESAGIDLAFRAIRAACESDDEALDLGFRFMDGLIVALKEGG